MRIDIDRCREAMRHLWVSGDPSRHVGCSVSNQAEGGRPRHAIISKAIASIQEDGAQALSGTYLYVKNYAHFGDQSGECRDGMAPSHGSVVFSIYRTRGAERITLGDDHVYMLECVRDFGVVSIPVSRNGRVEAESLNLCEAIARLDALSSHAGLLQTALESASVESHVPVHA